MQLKMIFPLFIALSVIQCHSIVSEVTCFDLILMTSFHHISNDSLEECAHIKNTSSDLCYQAATSTDFIPIKENTIIVDERYVTVHHTCLNLHFHCKDMLVCL